MSYKIIIAIWIVSAVVYIGSTIAEKIVKKKNTKNDQLFVLSALPTNKKKGVCMQDENIENSENVEDVVQPLAYYYDSYQEQVVAKLTSIEEKQQTIINNTSAIGVTVVVVLIYMWISNIFRK